MSAEVERVFSRAKITITDRRNRLKMDTIEQLECLKSWLGLDNWELERLIDSYDHESIWQEGDEVITVGGKDELL